ncbi:MAG: DNA repair protein RecO [Propionibacteriaceae bacterium]|jgi:DNA repair protein RecO (recombination protein O)|nr:DNA repair protein RecO [Propionibacteriaceae bacterium]
MPTYRDQAVVLRTHKLGEADRIITMLTREHGKVRAVARGVRRTSSKFGARLEPFAHIDIQLAKGHALDVVAQAQALHLFGDALAANYPSFTVGEVMLETCDRLVSEENEPALQQYHLLLGALNALATGTSDGPRPATMILDSYLLRALSIAGYAPHLGECWRCGNPREWFSPSGGGAVCADCRPSGSVRPSEGAWYLMGLLLAGEWQRTADAPEPVCAEVSGIVAAFTNWHLEHSLRSLPFVDRA